MEEGMSRRRFLASLGVAGTTLACGGWDGDAPQRHGTSMRGKLLHQGMRILLQTSFEKEQFHFEQPGVEVTEGPARTGRSSLKLTFDAHRAGHVLEVPLVLEKGGWLYVQLYLRADTGAACRLCFAGRQGEAPFTPELPVPTGEWRIMEGFLPAGDRAEGKLRIHVRRTAQGAGEGGTVRVDDLVVAAFEGTAWPEAVQERPVLACDRAGGVWAAVLERRPPRSAVRVYRVEGDRWRPAGTLAPEEATALGAPVLAGLDRGWVVAFPAEQGDRWRMAFAFAGGGREPACRFIEAPGTVQAAPALAAAGKEAWIAWESNPEGRRCVLACPLRPEGAGEIEPVSPAGTEGRNPALAALEDGSLFAAWESVRKGGADLYGAWRRNGRWSRERRLTGDGRIERHPALAAWKNEVWMAWQAQSYPARKINRVEEQRIVAARVDAEGLSMPLGLFEAVSRPGDELLRPTLAFDPEGRLWLTARKSMHHRYGWQAVTWCYTGGEWHGPRALMPLQGRWHPVSCTWTPGGMKAAVQYDDVPHDWKHRGKNPDWHSAAAVLPLWEGEPPPAAPLRTAPLAMPPTVFSLAAKAAQVNADLPRQRWKCGEKELLLFFGDFHEHSALSVCARSLNPPPCDLYVNARDMEKLDFLAVTDHGFDMDRPTWMSAGEAARLHHDPGRFVTFLAQEWTSSANPPAEPGGPNRYGHHNLVFLDPHHPRFYDAFDGDISPAELWERLQGVEFICIPHQLADWTGKGKYNPPTDWNYTDERLQPLAEIFQKRQSYEYLGCPRQAPKGTPFKGHYLQDAWARGVIIGVIASPDHGGGMGRIGVWAEALTRESLFAALRSRHTFGTTGAKVALRFRSGKAIMGDKVVHDGKPIPFEAHVLAAAPVKEMVIFRNNRVVHRRRPGAGEARLEWTDEAPPDRPLSWYYVRVLAENNEMAWSSPIWFLRKEG